MERYGNISREQETGNREQEIGEHSIAVQFSDDRIYLYTYRSTGKKHIETMKQLAQKGRGPGTYISREIREHFDRTIDQPSLPELP